MNLKINLAVISFLLLYASNISAQFQQMNSDGSSCIQCGIIVSEIIEGDPNFENETCDCNGLGDVFFFNNYFNQLNAIRSATANRWLEAKQRAITKEVNRRFGKDFKNYRDARLYALQGTVAYVHTRRPIISLNEQYPKEFENVRLERDTYNARARALSNRSADINENRSSIDFGDLRYNGKFIRNLNLSDIKTFSKTNTENVISNNQEYFIINNKNRYARTLLQDYRNYKIDNKFYREIAIRAARYNDDFNYPRRIQQMHYYLSIFQESLLSPGPSRQRLNEIGIKDFGLEFDMQSLSDQIIKFQAPEIPVDFLNFDTRQKEIYNYAIATYNSTKISSALRGSLKNLGFTIRQEFENARYKESLLSATKSLLISAIDNTTLTDFGDIHFHSYKGYPDNHPIFLLDRKQNSFSANLALTVHTGDIQRDYMGYYNIVDELQKYKINSDFPDKTVGAVIRKFLDSDYIVNHALYSDTDLGKIFNINFNGFKKEATFTDITFQGLLGEKFYNGGYPIERVLTTSFASEAAKAIFNGGRANIEDEIILRSDFLKTPAYCVYGRLKRTDGDLFRQTIGSFIDDPEYKLYFTTGTCKNTDLACTDQNSIENGVITIIIEDTKISSLNAAATLLHEGIHAELFRFVKKVHDGKVDPNNRSELFRLYDFYKGNKFQSANAQHAYMTANYVIPIAKAIRDLDGNRYPLQHYMGFGWDGLRDYDYTNLLSDEESDELYDLQEIVNKNTKFDPRNCN